MFLSRLFNSRVLTREEKNKLKELEKRLQYQFKDLTLLKRSLSHKSYANENKLSSLEQNERYEFLGDAVLELAISHLIMEIFPSSTEGDLSKLRAAVVNEQSLAVLARQINLGDYLFLGRGEEQCLGRTKDSLLSDAYEAVLGAIYLDNGFKPAFRVIKNQFTDILMSALRQDIIRDYKTKLQEISQEKFRAVPQYRLVGEKGPDHDKIFLIQLVINDQIYGQAEGRSKKQAEQGAARLALEKLGAR